ncbi:hypothetical protein Y1Q_0018088 [Alligator mississippiensis]|uniref:Uncharacterized protein n=1 Tax=Alligator mississippiensis TaxID=8496 RepID=A0A151NP05_ALLMI|nr:hypothetical protein Y1Q_0018088 [Alligator mississippiensis]
MHTASGISLTRKPSRSTYFWNTLVDSSEQENTRFFIGNVVLVSTAVLVQGLRLGNRHMTSDIQGSWTPLLQQDLDKINPDAVHSICTSVLKGLCA